MIYKHGGFISVCNSCEVTNWNSLSAKYGEHYGLIKTHLVHSRWLATHKKGGDL